MIVLNHTIAFQWAELIVVYRSSQDRLHCPRQIPQRVSMDLVLSLAGGLHGTARWRCGGYLGRTIDYGRVVNPSRQVRTFRDLFLITELLDSKAETDDVGFGAELALDVLSDRAGFPVC